MLNRDGIQVDGKRYISVKVASNWWNVTQATVRKYCKNNEVPGAFLDSSKRWCIPVNAIKPFTQSTIKQVLRLTIQLKANRKLVINYDVLGIEPCNLGVVYDYLVNLSLLTTSAPIVIPSDIPKMVDLTDKGWSLAFSGDLAKKEQIKIEDTTKLIQLATALASMASALSKVT